MVIIDSPLTEKGEARIHSYSFTGYQDKEEDWMSNSWVILNWSEQNWDASRMRKFSQYECMI